MFPEKQQRPEQVPLATGYCVCVLVLARNQNNNLLAVCLARHLFSLSSKIVSIILSPFTLSYSQMLLINLNAIQTSTLLFSVARWVDLCPSVPPPSQNGQSWQTDKNQLNLSTKVMFEFTLGQAHAMKAEGHGKLQLLARPDRNSTDRFSFGGCL